MMKAGFAAAVLAAAVAWAGGAGAQGGEGPAGRLWEREPGVVVGPEAYGASPAVLQLLEAGRLDDAAAECEQAEGELGLTAETVGNWLALADALWNAGEREAAGLAVERVWADEWPENVRAMAQLSSKWRDEAWSEMSRPGGSGADSLAEEVELAMRVLGDCYDIVFKHMVAQEPEVSESVVLGRMMADGTRLPETLDDVPEWKAHVEGTWGIEREMCERIAWRPQEEKVASIDLGGGAMKAVMLRGGAMFTMTCWSMEGLAGVGEGPKPGEPFVVTNGEDMVFSRGYRAGEEGAEPNVLPKGTKITVFPQGYRGGETAAEPQEKEPLGQRIAERLQEKGWPVEGAIAAISLLPIVELRGAIPAGHVLIGDEDPSTHFGREDWARAGKAFLWAVVGNLLPIPFILWLLGPLSRAAMRWGPGRRFFEWLFARTRRKTADIEKYEFWGLALFVAVPLPVTGAWTGAMAGWLLGIPFWQALASIAIGVCAAGCIMTALSLMGWVGLAIALAALVVVFGGGAWRAVRKK
jgi:uncharacterized membrane protein